MLELLKLKNVGPAPEMTLDFAPRLNLLTGDNGLGKSFLLDVAWWSLTRKWPHDLNPKLTSGYPARPTDPKRVASIEFALTTSAGKPVAYESTYGTRDQAWLGRAGRPWNPGLVLYAHADGGFAVWDPARNYWKKRGNIDVQERLPGYVFSPNDVWHGLDADLDGKPTKVCNGLLTDWAGWIRERGDTAQQMQRVLESLSPPGEHIAGTSLVRLSVDDARDIPAIRTPYAESVPILHASSGLRRVVGLAYMLLWSWTEHLRASELIATPPTRQIVLLFDELESHLHPRWQRSILRSLLNVMSSLHADASIQLLAATHSPLILASAEPYFDAEQDAWFDLDLDSKNVVLTRRPFVRHGEVSNWLTSEAFDLGSARSIDAEAAIEKAMATLREASPSKKSIEDAHRALAEAKLPDIDPFWVRWRAFLEDRQAPKKRGKPGPRR
jgi:AAA domain, putative AbiEii toxin, Type IV TA system